MNNIREINNKSSTMLTTDHFQPNIEQFTLWQIFRVAQPIVIECPNHTQIIGRSDFNSCGVDDKKNQHQQYQQQKMPPHNQSIIILIFVSFIQPMSLFFLITLSLPKTFPSFWILLWTNFIYFFCLHPNRSQF